MTTRNFVPRADGEGSIGTAAKNWFSGYFKQLNVASMTVNDNQNPIADTAALATLLSNLANMVKQNKGTDDWKTAPATNLATLAALVGNLASGSDVTWEGNKFTNAKLGITGLMEQNGYICFGKNFGGLILQWGYVNANRQGCVLSYPVTMTTLYAIVSMHLDRSSSPVTPVTISCFRPGTSNVQIVTNVDGPAETLSIIIGK